MPDGNAPSSLPRPDLSGLLDDVGKSLGQLHARAGDFARAANEMVQGLEEMNDLIRLPGSGFQAEMDGLREQTAPYAAKGQEVEVRAAAALARLNEEAATFASRSPTEQQETIRRLRSEAQALTAEAAVFAQANQHFQQVGARLHDLGERAGNMPTLNGRRVASPADRIHEIAGTADRAAIESEDLGREASRFAEHETNLQPMEEALAAESQGGSTGGQGGSIAQNEQQATEQIDAQRASLRASLTDRRRKALDRPSTSTDSATPAPDLETDSIPQEAQAPLQEALTEAAKKSREKTKEQPPTEPATGEPMPAAKETIRKPPVAESSIPAAVLETEARSPSAQDAETKRPTRDLNSAAIATAIQETMNAETRAEQQADEAAPTTAPGTSREPKAPPTEQQAINEARAELKGKYAERKRDAEILTLYGERMSTRSWEYLQTHDATRYGQLQIAQASIPNLTIDASIFLTTEERQAVHLAATVDVRASHPEVTDERLSSLLLSQAQSLLRVEQAGQAAGMAATLAIAGVLAGTQAAQVATAGATSAVFAALYQQIGQTQAALAQEEQHSADRAQIIKMQTSAPSAASGTGGSGTGTTSAGRGGQTTLQSQQRQGLDTRRGLQAALHAQIQQAMAGSALGEALAQAGALSGAQAQAANGLLAFILPTNLRPTADAGRMNGADGRDILRSGDSKEATENTTDASDRSDYEAGLAAKLAAQQLQDRRFQGSSQAKGGTGGSIPSSALLGNDGNPLLDANRTRPLSPQEIFTRKQAAMRKRTDDFAGIGQEASGYEAAFGEAGAALPNAGADVIEVQDGDLIPVGGTVDGEPTTESLEEARVQELLQRQQQERAAQSKESKLDQLKKLQNLKNNPLANQAKGQALKLLGTPLGLVAILVVAFVVIIWLNIRLFFSDEESSWRKPLGTWGMVGTLALDLFAVINVLFSFILLVILCIIPFIPGLLAAGGIFATLQAAFRLFGG